MSFTMRLATRALRLVSGHRLAQGESGARYLASVKPGRRPARHPLLLRLHGTLTWQGDATLRVWRYEPRNARPGLEMLYIHGGSYLSPLARPHWWIVDRIARSTGASIMIPDYPLAPEHHADDTIATLDRAWQRIVERPTTRWPIVAGDSAGGHAALTLARRHERTPLAPVAAIAISPWVDLALQDPAARRRERIDPMLRVEGLRAAATSWAAPLPPTDPSFALLGTDLTGFPPTLLLQGRHDIFYNDTLRFAKELRAAGVDVTLLDEPDAFHVYPGAIVTPESRRAFGAIRALTTRVTR